MSEQVEEHKGIFYIVGSRKEPERAKRWMDAMMKEGWANSYDWTLGLPPDPWPTDDPATNEATKRVQAVLVSDLVWVLMSEEPDAEAQKKKS